MGARPKDSCREYCKTLQILALASHYILSIALFIIRNTGVFKMKLEILSFNTMVKINFFYPIRNLKTCQKEPCYSGITVFNKLPL